MAKPLGQAGRQVVKGPDRSRAWLLSSLLVLASFVAVFVVAPAPAVAQTGTTTGLRIPRYVSLKSDRVNLREGPSKDHRTSWIFQRSGLPVEVTAEFENWRRIRDSEGSEGWVLQSLLSGRRTAIVAPWKRNDVFPIYSKPSESADQVAKLQSGVQANVRKCDPLWCRVNGDGFEGYIRKALLWGVYPDEQMD